jgi:hypothetical protein
MTRYLPDDLIRCSAYWYALRAGLVTDPCDPGDLEFLRELGLRAASLARWEGIPALTVPEGPWPAVYLWPERIWSEVADEMLAARLSGYGDYGLTGEEFRILNGAYGPGVPIPYARPDSSRPWVHDVLALDRRYGDPENSHGYWEAGDYG